MRTEIILLLVYFSGRLFFFDPNILFSGKAVQKGSILKRIAWGVWSFLLVQNTVTALLLLLANGILVFLDSYIKLPKDRQGNAGRLYLVQMIQSVVFWPWLIQKINSALPALPNPITHLSEALFPMLYSSARATDIVLLILLGYIFILQEATLFIQLVLKSISAVPEAATPEEQPDTRELERGKIIGILERSFYYFLILSNNFGGIAIIIALKSLARFKELDRKRFAEYFLIGSLLSLAAAAVPATLIRLLM